jgi:hypothetical protein
MGFVHCSATCRGSGLPPTGVNSLCQTWLRETRAAPKPVDDIAGGIARLSVIAVQETRGGYDRPAPPLNAGFAENPALVNSSWVFLGTIDCTIGRFSTATFPGPPRCR